MQELTPPIITSKPSQNYTPCKIRKQQRIDQMLQLIFNGETDFTVIAEEIGVSRKQAYNYWNQWLQTEEPAKVQAEWWSLAKQLKQTNPSKAFEGLTRIKYRMTTEKHEVKAEIKEIRLEWQIEHNPADTVQTPPQTT